MTLSPSQPLNSRGRFQTSLGSHGSGSFRLDLSFWPHPQAHRERWRWREPRCSSSKNVSPRVTYQPVPPARSAGSWCPHTQSSPNPVAKPVQGHAKQLCALPWVSNLLFSPSSLLYYNPSWTTCIIAPAFNSPICPQAPLSSPRWGTRSRFAKQPRRNCSCRGAAGAAAPAPRVSTRLPDLPPGISGAESKRDAA